MEQRSFQIWITSYEFDKNKWNPILTHVFYGKTIDEAYGYARSHLITDYFFSSSFLGEMPWKNTVLRMSNKGELIDTYGDEDTEIIEQILKDLTEEAKKIADIQDDLGLVVVINEIADSMK
jgi:hypothetical protein